MMTLVLFVGVAFSTSRYYGVNEGKDAYLLFSIYLAILTTATLAAFSSRLFWRRFWRGYASFGWVYLVCALRIGWFAEQGFRYREGDFSLGMSLGLLCGLVALWFLPPPPEVVSPAPHERTSEPS